MYSAQVSGQRFKEELGWTVKLDMHILTQSPNETPLCPSIHCLFGGGEALLILHTFVLLLQPHTLRKV